MKFHPKGFYSVNATLVPVGSIPGQTQAFFHLEPDAERGIGLNSYVLASEFLAQYEPGTSAGKPAPNAIAERAAVDALIATLPVAE